ncbi:DUF4168 domain-containing protein [Zunongwangia sp.]|uniref:DUF4168 domain-containing protein n=1 Tax=Zunongwangia sp. TaxID=1965325 RepID=UPI003AA96216
MIKFKKFAGLLFILTIFTGSVATAQQPTTPQKQVDVDVSDAELAKFAEAYQGLRMMNQEINQQMMKVVQDGGLDVQRFNEIHQASSNPDKEVEATEEELQKHKAILADIEGMQKEVETKMENVIKDKGLTMQRYEKLAMALQTDQELQSRLQKMLTKG